MPWRAHILAVGLTAALVVVATHSALAGALVTEPPKVPPADTTVSRYVEGTGFGHYSPGVALGVGLGTTLAPLALATIVSPIGGDSDFAWEAALAVSATAGLIVGPAVGLASGGRADLAARGAVIRGLGLLGAGVGLLGFGLAMSESDSGPRAGTMMTIGALGALTIGVSALHDLAITPSAVEARGRPRAALLVRPGGALGVAVVF